MDQFGMNTMQNMGNTLGQEGMQFTNWAAQLQAAAPNPWEIGAQLLGGLGGSFLGGGGMGTILGAGAPGKKGGGSGSVDLSGGLPPVAGYAPESGLPFGMPGPYQGV